MALEGAGVRVDVRPVSSLLPHEDTIPSHVERIALEIKQEGIQRDPIIVDSESGAVLDGMHRLAAFARLGLESAVCCPLDYSSKNVSLHRWARVYSSDERGDLSKALLDAGISRSSTLTEAFASLDARKCGLAALSSQRVFLPAAPTDLQGAFAVVRGLDVIAYESGWKREFVSEDEVDSALQDERNIVVLVQRLGKDDVVAAARSGRLFPCKTSMHTVDPRPVAVNVPIERLGSLTGAELRKQLQFSGGKLFPSGTQYRGRRYKERLFILNPE
ncbi:MAG: ParB N-terminal domain-containing protein [Nitrososphaerales archaeon]